MNVALTRAKFGCWVVGNGRALRTSTHWRALLDAAAGAGALLGLDAATPAAAAAVDVAAL